MAATRLSPAASLLRNSRLFALPPALTPPAQEASSEPEGRSDTATTPYPTRAAIETPLLSLNKGDWGLKRPLPLKSTTQTGTPAIRIQRGIDTIEHIADFESAADHALTLKKWQQLSMPITAPETDGSSYDSRAKSVFDPSYDNTSSATGTATPGRQNTGVWPNTPTQFLPNVLPSSTPETKPQARPPTTLKRWQYEGPWLAGMTGMEFEAYLKKEVRQRRGEFREKVKEHMIAERTSRNRMQALEEGQGIGSKMPAQEVTEEEISEHIRLLRSKPEMFGALIAEFLDLPEGPDTAGASALGSDAWRYGRTTNAAKVYADVGPPKTHPSAGLSYLKVGPKAYARNDPVFGPQMRTTPVQARVLKTRRTANNVQGSLGVAGFVANKVEVSGSRSNQFEPFKPNAGGHKRIVRPTSASIGPDGKLNLNVVTDTNHRLTEDESVERMDGRPSLRAAAIAASFDSTIPYLDSGYNNQNSRRRRQTSGTSPSSSEGLNELKRAFDPFGKRGA